MNVIIVEDDRVISLLLSKMVDRLGFNILDKVTKGHVAYNQIKDLKPDLIFMDIMLEDDLNGIDVMKQLRENDVDIPVIYITGNSDPFNKARAEETDYLDFLIKPVSFEELSQAVNKLS